MITSLIYGGITHHYLTHNFPYCNTINNVGTINNSYVIATIGSEKFKGGIISGTDSTCSPIMGLITQTKLTDNFDFVLGAYNANERAFEDLGITPISMYGHTPVVGVNYNITLYEKKDFKIKLHNLISIDIISHAIGIEF